MAAIGMSPMTTEPEAITPMNLSRAPSMSSKSESVSNGGPSSASTSSGGGGGVGGGGRGRVLDAATLASRLPPQLAALRAGVPGVHAASVPPPRSDASSSSAPAAAPRGSAPAHLDDSAIDESGESDAETGAIDRRAMARKLSMMSITPSGNNERRTSMSDGKRPSLTLDMSSRRGSIPGTPGTQYPILVNQACSGYFVEPLTWMEPFLADGQLAGKIVCPNEKCKAKIGSYDWAGVQCGCKEWVVPVSPPSVGIHFELMRVSGLLHTQKQGRRSVVIAPVASSPLHLQLLGHFFAQASCFHASHARKFTEKGADQTQTTIAGSPPQEGMSALPFVGLTKGLSEALKRIARARVVY